MAFAPNGADLLFACGDPYAVTEVSLSEFSTVTSYNTGPYPQSVAVSPDGQTAIGVMEGTGTAAIDLVSPAGVFTPPTYPENHFGVPGVAWSSTNLLYAVTEDLANNSPVYTYALHAFLPEAQMTLTGPTSASHGSTVTLTGTVTSAAPLGTGLTVSVSRVDAADPSGISVGTATVAPDGSFTFTDTASVLGTSTYTVTTAGGAIAPSLATATVWVHPPVFPWKSIQPSPTPTHSAVTLKSVVRH